VFDALAGEAERAAAAATPTTRLRALRARVGAAEAELRRLVEEAAVRDRRHETDARDADARELASVVAAAHARDTRRRAAVFSGLSTRLAKSSRHCRGTSPSLPSSSLMVDTDLAAMSAMLSTTLCLPLAISPMGCPVERAMDLREACATAEKTTNSTRDAPLRAADALREVLAKSDPRVIIPTVEAQTRMVSEQLLTLAKIDEAVPVQSFEDAVLVIEKDRIASHAESKRLQDRARAGSFVGGPAAAAARSALVALRKRLAVLEERRRVLREAQALLKERRETEHNLRQLQAAHAERAVQIVQALSAEMARASGSRVATEKTTRREVALLVGRASRGVAAVAGGRAMEEELASLAAVDWSARLRRVDPLLRDSWLHRQVYSRLAEWRVPWPLHLVPWLTQFLETMAARRLSTQQRSRAEATLSRRTVPLDKIAAITSDISMCCRHHDQSTVTGEWLPSLAAVAAEIARATGLCEETRTLAHEWWAQPAQFAIPALLVDGVSLERWTSLWREITDRLV
jgi:hypothetical protein